MKLCKTIGALLATAVLILPCFFVPFQAFATTTTLTSGAGGFIPCAGPDCNFGHVIMFANTLVGWLLRIAIPASAALFSYAGFLYLTSAGNPGKKTLAHKVFWSVFWGFAMALSAWIIVNFLTNFFLDKDINEVIASSDAMIISVV